MKISKIAAAGKCAFVALAAKIDWRKTFGFVGAAFLLCSFCLSIQSIEFFRMPSWEYAPAVLRAGARMFLFFFVFVVLIRFLPFALRAFFWAAVLVLPSVDWFLFFYTGDSAFSFVLKSALVTNLAEVLAWIDASVACGVLAFVGVCALLAFVFRSETKIGAKRKAAIVGVLIFSFFAPSLIVFTHDSAFPIKNNRVKKSLRSVAKSVGNPLFHYAGVFVNIRNASSLYYVENLPKLSDLPTVCGSEEEECVFILHIGESVRSANLPLAGYFRNTTPFCVKFKERGNLFDFNDAQSIAASTVQASLAILTGIAPEDVPENGELRAKNGSFVGLFAKHGFRVSQWFCFNNIVGAVGSENMALAFLMSDFPEIHRAEERRELVAEMQLNAAKNKRCFMLYNERGSHEPFYFSAAFDKFLPRDGSRAERARAEYDNTILETDAFIGSVVNALQGKKLVYVYVSDHGTAIGENGIFGRNDKSRRSRVVRTIPLYIYLSDEFKTAYPDAAENLKKNLAAGIRTGHANVAHTMLGLAKISTPPPFEIRI